jgi:hypothetical protein
MAVEQIVSMPIINPDTGKPSRTFEFAGKTDKVEGDTVIDWKGTGDAPRFIRQHAIGFQAECYALACQAAGYPIWNVEYRLIERPTIKYRRPTFTWAVMKPGGKRALRVCDTEDEARKLATMRGANVEARVDGHKDRDVYERACLDWLCHPDFPHRVLDHTYMLSKGRLDTARHWLWNCGKRLLDCRSNMRWLPNEQACYTYNCECPYMPLCEAVAEGSDVRWVKETDYVVGECHPELNGYKGDKMVVTYSSLSCLSLCEVKYFWRHVECLRRATGEDAEPLWIGSAMHRGMEALGDGADMDAALAAVDEWAAHNPVLGEDAAWKQDQQIARARAMVRVAAMKWGQDAVDVTA